MPTGDDSEGCFRFGDLLSGDRSVHVAVSFATKTEGFPRTKLGELTPRSLVSEVLTVIVETLRV
jgi:hypothetical protein